MRYTAIIEQTDKYQQRMKYIPEKDCFIEKDCISLSYMRNVHQPYGWIKESGTPPNPHLDVIIMTDKQFELGNVAIVRIIGVFCRNDGDHKLVAVLENREINDFSELEDSEKEDMHRLYPREDIGEGWFGREKAEKIIRNFHKSKMGDKNIIMVQHTQSQHHVNKMIGAWGDWELTDIGKEQAKKIGKWIENRIEKVNYKMYVSDLMRAMQTADEINKYLAITPIITEAIREVNAGQGNGKPIEWYRKNQEPISTVYDPDYKPFADAESDRNLWDRLYPFYLKIVDNEEANIIIVSHGTTLSFLQSMFFGDKFEDIAYRRFNGSAGAISNFLLKSDGKVVVRYINFQGS